MRPSGNHPIISSLGLRSAFVSRLVLAARPLADATAASGYLGMRWPYRQPFCSSYRLAGVI
jgi:hypothetical protein